MVEIPKGDYEVLKKYGLMDEEKHPNRVICPKCGRLGTKRAVMKKCGKPRCGRCPHGPYWYVAHREGSRVTECYIGRTWPVEEKQKEEDRDGGD